LKEHILQSQLSEVLNKQDFQYLMFIIEEFAKIHNRPYDNFLTRRPDTSLDEAKRVERAIDIYLSPAEKAVFFAHSKQINKRFPINDFEIRHRASNKQLSDSLGQCLYQRYGKQYHAVGIQFGERTCPMDSSRYMGVYPAKQATLFPLSFEQAAFDTGIPYFYYPSSQLPDGISGINLDMNSFSFKNPYSHIHIFSHFDALVFIREVKAIRNRGDYSSSYWSEEAISEILDIEKLLKELKK
jgi:erythromycin esterase-like protein